MNKVLFVTLLYDVFQVMTIAIQENLILPKRELLYKQDLYSIRQNDVLENVLL